MFNNYVFLKRIDVIDENFTEEMTDKWRNHLLDSYENVFKQIKPKIDYSSSISFFLSNSLLEEVIVDAIIGLKKITGSQVHSVPFPNTFKIAAYLAYWWLRHKPVSLHYGINHTLEDAQINGVDGLDKETAELERQKLIWKLKHINEIIAVQIVMSFIFRFDKVFCSKTECKRLKGLDGNFTFDDFETMKEIILQKLIYYFSYRPITPKVIEHILEAYTLHPAWSLTGPHWAEEKG